MIQKLNIRLVHGKNSMAEEKRLLKEIKSSEETTDDPPISLESLKYSVRLFLMLVLLFNHIRSYPTEFITFVYNLLISYIHGFPNLDTQ